MKIRLDANEIDAAVQEYVEKRHPDWRSTGDEGVKWGADEDGEGPEVVTIEVERADSPRVSPA